jgi:hypothetical protein
MPPAAEVLTPDDILAHGYGELRVVITDGVILSFSTTTHRRRAAPAYRP